MVMVVVVTLVAERLILTTFFPSRTKPSTNNSTLPQNQVIKNVPPTSVRENNQAYLGIRYRMIDKQTAELNNISEGAYISQIIDNSPARNSDLIEEDIIIEFDGKLINGADKQILSDLISEKNPGEKINLKISRNKEIKTISVTLGSAK